MRDSNGAITVYDLNSLVVNVEALDLSLTSAAAIDVGGPESRIVIAGWGMEMAGGSTFTSPRDTFPHWFLLVEDLPIEAVVDVHPDVLNPRSRGRWLTCYIELPEGYDLADIDVSTVLLNETVPADEDPTEVGDHDGDGIPDLMVKFSRSEVIGVLPHGRGEVEVRVSGEVAGLRFEGIDAIRVLDERHDGGGGTVHDDSDGALTSDSRAGLPGSGDVPNTFALRQCSPNPFSVSTVIGFDLPHATSVSIRVYDTEGRAVTTLTEGLWPSGRHSASWDGADEAGKRVSPGIYFVHMKSGEYKATSKLLMVR
jgi:hypothetical protein